MGRGIRIGATVGILAALYQTYRAATGTGDPGIQVVQAWTGYHYGDGTFNWKKASALIPAVAGAGASMAASKIGLNRYTPKGLNI
ncbi:unnamed protein product [marine sediment metagenome]|uniref:Uncharacterized protein n=1 Tax=marine sediment metagenome TaxID=412755 RepID=X1CVI2_9ZZZZ